MAGVYEEECDFDTLRDILENSDEETAVIGQPDTGVADKTKSEEDSSDDDIDEDELDTLTALVEGDENTNDVEVQTPIKTSSSSKLSADGDGILSPSNIKQEDDKFAARSAEYVAKHEKVGDPDPDPEREMVPETKNEKQHESVSVLDYTQKLKELEAMQEKVKQLEAQLKLEAMQEKVKQLEAQLKKDKKPDIPTKTDDLKSPELAKELSSAKKDSKSTNKHRIRPIETDIFGKADSSSTPASTSKVKQPTSSQRPTPSKKSSVAPTLSNPNDSDSDWEGMDGEKPGNLSKQGREIKKLLSQGTRERIAHTPRDSPINLNVDKKTKSAPTTSKQTSYTAAASNRFNVKPASTGNHYTSSGSTSNSDPNIIHEPLSGIRIIKPLISNSQLKSLMKDRRHICLSKLHSKTKSLDLESDWVTLGVLVSKTEPRKSQKGNQYSIWRLSDLDDCDKTVNFFLFNKVFQEHWKTITGSVIGLLNPSLMQKEETKQSQDVSITIDNPKKMLLVGQSKDLGRCRAKTKAGNDCTNFVNITRGDFCTFHVQKAYKKHSSKRAELQAGSSGVVPKSFEKQLFNKGSTVIYAGQSFSTTGHSGTTAKNKNKAVSIQSLQQHHVKKAPEGRSKMSTLQLHDILPEDKAALKQMKVDKNEKFHEALTVPTVGSMNFVKHLKVRELHVEKEKVKDNPMQSISVQNFMKHHGNDVKSKIAQNRQRSNAATASGLQPSVSSAEAKPSLGKGFAPGDDIFFDLDDTPTPSFNLKAENAKLKAIAKVKSTGGIKRTNPNEAHKKTSPAQKDQIKKRLAEGSPDNDHKEENPDEPPRKRTKVLGNLDLQDEDVQKLLNARSKHDTELTEREQEKFDQYFDPLEKKEAMEEKMRSITEVKCKAFTCKQCHYTHFAPTKECKERGHQVISHDAVKKFFECRKCKQRTITLDKYPQHACKKCGEQSFARCSMLKEKNGPKLPSEELLLRGEEIKFLSSMT